MEIVKMYFGSHLYGTNTPESDTDYKGVFLPSKKDVILGRVPKSINKDTKQGTGKNTSEDTDIEIYSLQYFIKLACEGQTVALDMLHAPDNMITYKHPIWDMLVKRRDKFYTKNLHAFIGYARKQAAKYGIKGSRLNATKDLIDILSSLPPKDKLLDHWDKLPIGSHSQKTGVDPNGILQYQMCGKCMQATQKIDYTLVMLNKFYHMYGARAVLAAENKGIDWKAVSHAIRAAIQVKELLTSQTITFPLKDANFLLLVKIGKLDYLTEVAPVLENLMDEVELLSANSTLPEKVNQDYWDNFMLTVFETFN